MSAAVPGFGPHGLRPAVDGDHRALLGIFNRSRTATGCFSGGQVDAGGFARRTRDEEIHVAKCGGRIAGFVAVWRPESFIHHLYVDPHYQNRGIGKALLTLCEREYGRPLSLKCESANTRALAFYRRNGWVVEETGAGPDGSWKRLWLRHGGRRAIVNGRPLG